MRGRKPWQAVAILLLVIMIALNLHILLSRPEDLDESSQFCDQPLVINIDGHVDVDIFNSSRVETTWEKFDSSLVKVVGNQRSKPGFLTIGIPSIKRINGMGSSYLLATISSVIDNTSAQDKTEVVVVVFLADADEEYNNQVLAKIMEQFSEFVAMGFIQVVQVSADYYPKLDGLKRNFNDKPDRVHWRAKQVADFTFMFSYAQNLSTYYIQIEDDVICAHGFVSAIRSFISHQKHWAVLEFSELGFIGKLFKSADLDKLSRYMMTFYDEQPVDWLITYFRLSMAQKNIIMRKPTLFQHVGLKSSFDTSKDNKLKDRFFDAGEKKLGDNPPATIITNMRAFEKYTPDLAYSPGNGYFWASGLSQNDSLYVIFDSDQVLEGIVVETGDVKHPKDVLNVGWVEASPKVRDMDVQKKTVVCENLTKIAVFRNGRAEAVHLSRVLSEKTRCLRVVVGASQSQWVIFYQIAVFVKSP